MMKEAPFSEAELAKILKIVLPRLPADPSRYVYAKWTAQDEQVTFYIMGYHKEGDAFSGMCINSLGAQWPALPHASWLAEGTILIYDDRESFSLLANVH